MRHPRRDPIEAKKRIALATEQGITLGSKAYGYKQAFKNSPTVNDLRLLTDVLTNVWGRLPRVVDPAAGGGSIPYEAIRYGLPTIANDLNSVAAGVLIAGIEAPAKWGADLSIELKKWGALLVDRVRDRLAPFFRLPDASDNNSYLFARTVACPRTGKPVPLAPNWWLAKGDKKAAVRLVTERDGRQLDEVEFEILTGEAIDFDPVRGTTKGGHGLSPWDDLAIHNDYIEAEAQAGRMGSQLYAVAIRSPKGRTFRSPLPTDISAVAAAEKEVARLLSGWLEADVVPHEEVDYATKTSYLIRYGMPYWRDLFSPRQLLVHGTFVEEFRNITPEVRATLDAERSGAVLTVLAMMMGKAINWNAILSTWDAGRRKMRSLFETHDFGFKWTYAEFEGARELYPWCLDQIVDAYTGIAQLLQPADAGPLNSLDGLTVPGPVTVTCGNAADLAGIEDRSVELVCIDPPYYDNVMYAELSDFFYVWEKRTLGLIHPELFADELTDKKNEAVANPARFAHAGRRKKELANADYEAKMTAIFAECQRILRDDGVLTVMFTHKRAEAWDTLGMGLMEAGFTIETSWPVNTESEQSLHQAKKNAAASTIMLVCRKRPPSTGAPEFFEDVEADVRQAAGEALDRFEGGGISGVDLLLSTYGPALSVISSRWPVYSSEADAVTGRSRLLRPEEALDAARTEVVRRQRLRLIGRSAQLDPLSDFVLISWSTFQAEEFPFDEARRLALATGGLDIGELARAKILAQKSGTVTLLPPSKRLRRADDALPGVRRDATSFSVTIDAVHTVMYVAETDGLQAAKVLIDRAGLANDGKFLACLQGLVNAIPRTRSKGQFIRKEASTLDAVVTAWFPSIDLPPDAQSAEAETLF